MEVAKWRLELVKMANECSIRAEHNSAYCRNIFILAQFNQFKRITGEVTGC
jgi:hypothetical protein